jgi:hypothetical protein
MSLHSDARHSNVFLFSDSLLGRSVGRVQQLPAHPPGAAADAQEDSTHTHVQVYLLFISTHAHRLHHVLPEKFLRNFLILKEFSFFFKLFFGYKQTGSSYLVLLVTPPPYSSFLFACLVFISTKYLIKESYTI